MTGDSCPLLAVHGIPIVVQQAQDDTRLSPRARRIMWHLRTVLDFIEYREQYAAAVAKAVGCREQVAAYEMKRLIALGYLSATAQKRPLRLRFPWSRAPMQRAA